MLRIVWQYRTCGLLNVEQGSYLADAADFFIYDTIRIFLLFSVIIFVLSAIRSFFPPERTERILSYKKQLIGIVCREMVPVYCRNYDLTITGVGYPFNAILLEVSLWK